MTLGPVMQASLAIAMLGAAALLLAGVRIVARGGAARRRGWLMIAVAAVLFGNVLIWAWP